jgi:hypothetical protein
MSKYFTIIQRYMIEIFSLDWCGSNRSIINPYGSTYCYDDMNSSLSSYNSYNSVYNDVRLHYCDILVTSLLLRSVLNIVTNLDHVMSGCHHWQMFNYTIYLYNELYTDFHYVMIDMCTDSWRRGRSGIGWLTYWLINIRSYHYI